ncbi:hypothetical protein DM01DRAFT_1331273 [Hesseltinella vesiculosa]|uniref:Uncharacterized protein n=1 Tax=Hesseltinella vesiculosa TaxID=101127 RepID=A0A1X2GYV7_9FUNG|nr:hypothetical protein DM01DRAFT_1331273 [Hesseltinella vesiculosa]
MTNQNSSLSKSVYPMPTGKQRLIALEHLGCTFREGDHDVVKIATPSPPQNSQPGQEDRIPTFIHRRPEHLQ